jgi:flagellar hook-associated protein 3 FlgL
MVNAISDLGQYTYIQSMLQTTQNQLNQTQDQISTGRVADTYAGLGGSATYDSLSLRSQANQLDAFNTAINNVTPITSAMDAAMTNVTSSAQSVLSSMQAVVQSGNINMTTLNESAQNALTSIQQMLNTQEAGVYVFSGSDNTNAPVASTSALGTAVNTDLSAFAGGTETAAQVLSNVGSYTAAQVGYSTTLASATNVTVPTAPNVNTDYTVKASNSGFQSVMKGLSIIANLQYDPSNETGFYQIYNGAMQMINSGINEATQDQATLGVATKAMTNAQTQITATQSVLNTSITNVEDLSSSQIAAASTKLSTLESQLQASYSIITQLQNLHLVDYLDGSV